jgi:hypothetical protein
MRRGAIVLMLISSLVFIPGCGGGDDSTTQAARTWSVTVADNMGPQGGPNPVTASRAVMAKYQGEGHPISIHGCHASSPNGQLWQCQVKDPRCNSTVSVVFDGPDDAKGEVGPSTTFCSEEAPKHRP